MNFYLSLLVSFDQGILLKKDAPIRSDYGTWWRILKTWKSRTKREIFGEVLPVLTFKRSFNQVFDWKIVRTYVRLYRPHSLIEKFLRKPDSSYKRCRWKRQLFFFFFFSVSLSFFFFFLIRSIDGIFTSLLHRRRLFTIVESNTFDI